MTFTEINTLLFSALLIFYHDLTTGNECEVPPGRRGRPLSCEQNDFTNWEVEVDRKKLEDEGRSPGITGHNKAADYYLSTAEWCEKIRPCPVVGGTPEASHNNAKAAEAFKRDATWTSGSVAKDVFSEDGVWIKYSFEKKDLAVGFILFEPSEDVKEIVFEGSKDGSSWESLNISRPSSSSDEWRFKVVSPKEIGSKSFHHYRLRITETMWREAGDETGSVGIGNLQLCLIDMFDDTNDNPYVASPPHISNAVPFASSRWGGNWHEKYAFYGPARAWSSEWLDGDQKTGTLIEPQYIGYSFPVARIVRKIRFMGSYNKRWLIDHPREFSIQGSDSMENWTTLSSVTLPRFRSIDRMEELAIPEENMQPFKNYRIYVTRTSWSMSRYPGGYLIMRAIRFC